MESMPLVHSDPRDDNLVASARRGLFGWLLLLCLVVMLLGIGKKRLLWDTVALVEMPRQSFPRKSQGRQSWYLTGSRLSQNQNVNSALSMLIAWRISRLNAKPISSSRRILSLWVDWFLFRLPVNQMERRRAESRQALTV